MRHWPLVQLVWIAGGGVAFSCGALFAASVFLGFAERMPWGEWSENHHVGMLSAVFLFFIGNLFLLEGNDGGTRPDLPLPRTLLCAGLAAIAVPLFGTRPPMLFDPLWTAGFFVIGGLVGYFGAGWLEGFSD